jgi:tight adherence protein B
MNRRRYHLAAAVAALAFLLVPGARAGGATGPDRLTVTGVDSTHRGTTTIAVSVPAGFADGALPASAWTVRESGVRRPVQVAGLPTDPAEVVLVIDTSGSMRASGLAAAQQAASAFVDRMPAAVGLAVVGFGNAPYVASGFTKDRGATKAAIGALTARGETAFYDAISTAGGLFTAGTHHAIVALTDGKDTASHTSLADAVDRLHATGASYDGIALTTAESDIGAVQAIATATGGRATSADAPGVLDGAYAQIANALNSQYRLTVSTTGSGSHLLAVTVKSGTKTAAASVRADLVAPPAPTSRPANGSDTRVDVAPDPGFWSSNVVLWLGLGIVFAGLSIGLAMALAPRAERSQLSGTTITGVRNGTSLFTTIGDRATQLAERRLEHKDRAGRLERALARAGIAMRPSEFVVVVATATFAVFAVILLLSGPLPALMLAAAVPLTCRMVVTSKGNKRSEKFQDQLEQTLPLMAGSLRAGFGLMQALDAVARESEAPTSDEFHRVVVETRLGRDVADAIESMAERVGSEDFDWVVQAIAIHRQVGGDLAQVLDNVYATIRDRNRIRRQVRALSAEGRLSAIILFVMPFAMLAVISVLNPGYVEELTNSSVGITMLIVAGALLAVGGLWLKRIVRLVF